MQLTESQLTFFDEQGYLIIPNFFSAKMAEKLMERATHLIDQFDHHQHKTVFSTTSQPHLKQQYFLDSANNISCFLEVNALNAQGELQVPKQQSINKIGHALHDDDEIFKTFSYSKEIAQLARSCNLTNPLLIQSMYICKQPHIGGEVICHQDATYLHSENLSVLGLWFALEDASTENGCLWAIPGAHKHGLKKRSIRNADNSFAEKILDASPWDTKQMIALEVKSGSLILLHSLLPHMSYKNVSAKSRHAYTLHIMDEKDKFSANNWLQRRKDKPFLRLHNAN